ncbi:hypothetical protein BC830DRAFT_1165912 [Chytriomyces sp. MP71]|nr:hypothetical protein BC830DRAFT_1165912 [Chytriomyces sp. MP71]
MVTVSVTLISGGAWLIRNWTNISISAGLVSPPVRTKAGNVLRSSPRLFFCFIGVVGGEQGSFLALADFREIRSGPLDRKFIMHTSPPHFIPSAAPKASHPLLRPPTFQVHFNVVPLDHDPDNLHDAVRELEGLLQLQMKAGSVMRAAIPSPPISPITVEKYLDRGVLVTVAPSERAPSRLPKAALPVAPDRVWIKYPDMGTSSDYRRSPTSIETSRLKCLSSRQTKSKKKGSAEQPYQLKVRLPKEE